MRTVAAGFEEPLPSVGVISEEDDERDLLRRVKAGDRRAAEELVERTYQSVFTALVRMTAGRRDLAADLTQDTYRKAWEAIGGFDGRSRVTTWLYRIAYNTFLNHVRKPDRTVPLDPAKDTAPEGPPPQEDLFAREEKALLRRAVLKLPDDLRFAVTAHFWGEMPVKEIARIENVTSMGIRKRLKRAFAALGPVLDPRHDS